MNLFAKFKGDGATRPPRPTLRSILLGGVGGCIAIAVIGCLAKSTGLALVLGSFGASCVLVFGFPDLPFSQPRHVVIGHCLSSFIGLALYQLLGPSWSGMALAAGCAIALMMATRTVHPPAGSNPVIIFLTGPSWRFLFFPTMAGALLLVVIALIFNNLVRPQRYPKYW